MSEYASETVAVYAAVGSRLDHYDLDAASGDLTLRGSIGMPSRVQCAWPHSRLPILYVACADRAPGLDDPFFLVAAAIADDGSLSIQGEPTRLPGRPIHITADAAGEYLLTAYSKDPGLTVHELSESGAVGSEVPGTENLDTGVAPHHVLVEPSGRWAILTARGAKGYGGPKYRAGALKVLSYDGGKLAPLASVAPSQDDPLAGFNPRHSVVHPSLPLIYVSLEGQNKLAAFAHDGERVEPEPVWVRELLADREHLMPHQEAGAVHLHPSGHVVYVANRNIGTTDPDRPSWLSPDPVPEFPGGENSIAAFALDPESGEPTLLQRIDSGGLHPRTFAIDPSGRFLIDANMAPMRVRTGDEVRDVPANLTVFAIDPTGRLSPRRTVPVELGGEVMTWVGMVS